MREPVRPDRMLATAPSLETREMRSGSTTVKEPGSTAESRSRWEGELRQILGDERTPLHVVGIGNALRSDDSVGVQIVSRLVRTVGESPRRNVSIHAPATTPERELSRVDCGKERVLILDSVEAGGRPGSVTLANLGDSKFGYFATHNVPVRIIPALAANPSNVYVVGIEPERLDVGEELSEAVRASAGSVAAVVESALGGGSSGHP